MKCFKILQFDLRVCIDCSFILLCSHCMRAWPIMRYVFHLCAHTYEYIPSWVILRLAFHHLCWYRLCAQMFVRALFDYLPEDDELIPCAQAGVLFHVGDILQVFVIHPASVLFNTTKILILLTTMYQPLIWIHVCLSGVDCSIRPWLSLRILRWLGFSLFAAFLCCWLHDCKNILAFHVGKRDSVATGEWNQLVM